MTSGDAAPDEIVGKFGGDEAGILRGFFEALGAEAGGSERGGGNLRDGERLIVRVE